MADNVTDTNNINVAKNEADSHEFYLIEGLKKMKTIFLNNEYLKYLLDQKMNLVLNNKKPEKPEIDATLCLNYSCSNTEQYCKQLVRKMKNSIPDYNINIVLRTVEISQLFSRSVKADYLPLNETSESIYHFICDCKEDYIGMCLIPLHHRIHKHGQPGRGGEHFQHHSHCKLF